MLQNTEVKDLIENTGFQIEEEELDEVSHYLSNKDFNDVIIKKLLNRKITFEKEKNYEKLKGLKVNSIISFFSLAKVDSFDITPIEKSMKIFGKVDSIYLIVTKESKNAALKYIDYFKSISFQLQIKIYDIETGNYEEVYNLLRLIIGGNNLKKENLVIDNTLGNKMTSAVFYRFGVEQGVRLITWQNEQWILPNEMIKRIPGTETFNFIKEPEFFNFNTFKNIDILLKNYKFDEAKMLYEQLNNRDMSLICHAFSKIFNFDTLSSLYGIYDETETFLKLTSNIHDQFLKKKIEKYRLILSFLTKEEEPKLNFTEHIHSVSWENFTDYQGKKLESMGFSEVEKQEFIALLIIEYYINAYPYDLASICIENTLCDDFPQINSNDFRPQLLLLYDKENSLGDFAAFMNFNEDIADLFEETDKLIFKPNLEFCKNLDDKISLTNGLLTIPSLGINEFLIKKLEFGTKSRNSMVIYELIKSPDHFLSSTKIIDVFKDFGKEITDKQRISKYYGDLKKAINEFNRIISIEAKKRGKNIEDFFLLENEFNKSFKSLKINRKL